jgi:hypothetical protein
VDRYRAVILLATEAGLRVEEIRGLQWTDIKDGQLTVQSALDAITNEALPPKHDKDVDVNEDDKRDAIAAVFGDSAIGGRGSHVAAGKKEAT